MIFGKLKKINYPLVLRQRHNQNLHNQSPWPKIYDSLKFNKIGDDIFYIEKKIDLITKQELFKKLDNDYLVSLKESIVQQYIINRLKNENFILRKLAYTNLFFDRLKEKIRVLIQYKIPFSRKNYELLKSYSALRKIRKIDE